MDGVIDPGGAIGSMLSGDAEARQRAYIELEQLTKQGRRVDADADEATVALAEACVAPLVDSVLCADVSRVGAVEFRRAGLVLTKLMVLDMRVCAQVIRANRWRAGWTSPDNALDVSLRKPPQDLTRDDIMLQGSCLELVAFGVMICKSWCLCCEMAGVEELDYVGEMMKHCPYAPLRATVPGANERRIRLAVEICRDYASSGMPAAPRAAQNNDSDLEIAGLFLFVYWCVTQRPELGVVAFDAGIFEVGVACMRKFSPVDWVSWRTPTGLIAGCVITAFLHVQTTASAAGTGVNVGKRLVDSGAAELMVALVRDHPDSEPYIGGIALDISRGYVMYLTRGGCHSQMVSTWCLQLQAYELRGPSKIHEANVVAISHAAMLLLPIIDLDTPEAQTIMQLLHNTPTTVRFGLEHEVIHMRALGCTVSGVMCQICALVFGRDEDGDGRFAIATKEVNEMLQLMQDQFTGTCAPFFPSLGAHWLRPVVHLSISDRQKQLLMQEGTADILIALLLDTLVFGEEHPRKEMDTSAAIQADAAGCFLQLAVFPGGGDLLQKNTATMQALRALADGQEAWSPAASTAAAAALVAMGVRRDPAAAAAGTGDGSDNSDSVTHGSIAHIMVSYQWDHQAVITRLVRSLQARSYVVWFDVDMMKGNTVDAMSAAVDNAACILYGVSLSYKESANCRLEANYGHQQEVDMIPLMLQDAYNPRGWLGMLLGTRMYYSFCGAEEDSTEMFDKRVDAVVREIGDDRGRDPSRVLLPPLEEGVPPTAAPSVVVPAPAAPRSSGAAPAAALATPQRQPHVAAASSTAAHVVGAHRSTNASTAPTTDHSFTPSVRGSPGGAVANHQNAVAIVDRDSSGGWGSSGGAEVQLLSSMFERFELRLEDRLKEQRVEIATQLTPRETVSDEELALLQARLRRLHAAQLLSDAQMFALEDTMADYVELKLETPMTITREMLQSMKVGATLAPAKAVTKLAGLSSAIEEDSALARQLKRKCL